ncbi:hypothetical protein ACF0H5_017129 [Mactra antiquata]
MWKIKSVSVVAVAVALNFSVFVRNTITIYSAHHFPLLDNLYIDDKYFLEEIENVYKIECAKACAETLYCVSFFYNKPQRKCRLHRSGWYNPQEGTTAFNWTYYVLGEDWCPAHDGFIHERSYNMCIHLSIEYVTGFSEATPYCASKKASVITFRSAIKISQFSSIMSKVNSTFLGYNENDRFLVYIGLRNFNGSWVWNDGSILSSETNWAPLQPSTTLSIKCTSVAFDKKEYGWKWQWNDLRCNRLLPVLCEIP